MINLDEVSTFGIKPRFTAIEPVFFSTPTSLIFKGRFFSFFHSETVLSRFIHINGLIIGKNKYLICMAMGNCLSVLLRSENMFWSSYMPFITSLSNSALSGLLNMRKLEKGSK